MTVIDPFRRTRYALSFFERGDSAFGPLPGARRPQPTRAATWRHARAREPRRAVLTRRQARAAAARSEPAELAARRRAVNA
jgi:hypothetical protein